MDEQRQPPVPRALKAVATLFDEALNRAPQDVGLSKQTVHEAWAAVNEPLEPQSRDGRVLEQLRGVLLWLLEGELPRGAGPVTLELGRSLAGSPDAQNFDVVGYRPADPRLKPGTVAKVVCPRFVERSGSVARGQVELAWRLPRLLQGSDALLEAAQRHGPDAEHRFTKALSKLWKTARGHDWTGRQTQESLLDLLNLAQDIVGRQHDDVAGVVYDPLFRQLSRLLERDGLTLWPYRQLTSTVDTGSAVAGPVQTIKRSGGQRGATVEQVGVQLADPDRCSWGRFSGRQAKILLTLGDKPKLMGWLNAAQTWAQGRGKRDTMQQANAVLETLNDGYQDPITCQDEPKILARLEDQDWQSVLNVLFAGTPNQMGASWEAMSQTIGAWLDGEIWPRRRSLSVEELAEEIDMILGGAPWPKHWSVLAKGTSHPAVSIESCSGWRVGPGPAPGRRLGRPDAIEIWLPLEVPEFPAVRRIEAWIELRGAQVVSPTRLASARTLVRQTRDDISDMNDLLGDATERLTTVRRLICRLFELLGQASTLEMGIYAAADLDHWMVHQRGYAALGSELASQLWNQTQFRNDYAEKANKSERLQPDPEDRDHWVGLHGLPVYPAVHPTLREVETVGPALVMPTLGRPKQDARALDSRSGEAAPVVRLVDVLEPNSRALAELASWAAAESQSKWKKHAREERQHRLWRYWSSLARLKWTSAQGARAETAVCLASLIKAGLSQRWAETLAEEPKLRLWPHRDEQDSWRPEGKRLCAWLGAGHDMSPPTLGPLKLTVRPVKKAAGRGLPPLGAMAPVKHPGVVPLDTPMIDDPNDPRQHRRLTRCQKEGYPLAEDLVYEIPELDPAVLATAHVLYREADDPNDTMYRLADSVLERTMRPAAALAKLWRNRDPGQDERCATLIDRIVDKAGGATALCQPEATNHDRSDVEVISTFRGTLDSEAFRRWTSGLPKGIEPTIFESDSQAGTTVPRGQTVDQECRDGYRIGGKNGYVRPPTVTHGAQVAVIQELWRDLDALRADLTDDEEPQQTEMAEQELLDASCETVVQTLKATIDDLSRLSRTAATAAADRYRDGVERVLDRLRSVQQSPIAITWCRLDPRKTYENYFPTEVVKLPSQEYIWNRPQSREEPNGTQKFHDFVVTKSAWTLLDPSAENNEITRFEVKIHIDGLIVRWVDENQGAQQVKLPGLLIAIDFPDIDKPW